jgi:hypothetical protein
LAAGFEHKGIIDTTTHPREDNMKRTSISYAVFALATIAGLLLGAAVPQPAAASPSGQTDGVRYG